MSITRNSTTNELELNGGTQTGNSIGFKNLINNGALDLWRRGTSFLQSSGGGRYTADRFSIILVRDLASPTLFTGTVTQETDIPTFAQVGTQLNYSLKYTVGTAKGSLATDDAVVIRTNLLGYDFAQIYHASIMLSFWVKSNLTGTFSVSFGSGPFTASVNKSYTISSANTWEKKTITLSLSDTVGRTIANGGWTIINNIGLRVSFSLAAGSGEVHADGSWFAGASEGVTGQTNLQATTGNTWSVAAIQMEPGTTATDFEKKPAKVELDTAEYFYQVWDASNHANAGSGFLSSTTVAKVGGVLCRPMRITPTVTVTGTASNFKIANNTSTSGQSSTALPTVIAAGQSPESTFLSFTNSGVWTGAVGEGAYALLTGDAKIEFDAEL